jgi:hypothetical protein
MGLKLEYIDGQTPIDEDEKEGLLIETITTKGDTRTTYIQAVKAADQGEYAPLITFARS